MSVWILPLVLAGLMLSGCGGKKQAKVSPPPPPPMAAACDRLRSTTVPAVRDGPKPPRHLVNRNQEKADDAASALSVPEGTKPLSVETGKASWYGAPYHNRRSSNGEIYDMNQLTAAHLTLPSGIDGASHQPQDRAFDHRANHRSRSLCERTNCRSLAGRGKAGGRLEGRRRPVRLEVLRTPVPSDHGGRWAVQIGSFQDEDDADKLANRLTRRYKTAKVLSFSSPVGDWWVRVRVLKDDRKRAEEVAHETQADADKVFLVRLD